MRFKGKKAVVVGAAEKSIGQAVARALAAEGADVCIWDINTESAGNIAKQITDAGGKAKVMKVNALDYADVKAATANTIKELGGIDFMIGTVGGGVMKPFLDPTYTPEFFRQQVELNGFSVFNCAHNVLPHMVEKNAGKLLFFTSTTGGEMNLAAYGAGKALLESLMKSIKADFAKNKIVINAILPGANDTPLTRNALKGAGVADVDAKLALMGQANPRGLNTPDSVAKVALFVLSEEADRLNGHVLTCH